MSTETGHNSVYHTVAVLAKKLCAPVWTRTVDLQLTVPILYPKGYWDSQHKNCYSINLSYTTFGSVTWKYQYMYCTNGQLISYKKHKAIYTYIQPIQKFGQYAWKGIIRLGIMFSSIKLIITDLHKWIMLQANNYYILLIITFWNNNISQLLTVFLLQFTSFLVILVAWVS